ncbi:MAG TPA: HNH endonuclease [Allosphingosinicella sp.]|nr:HNH endonuclease [Allosphingosinicella sp.]
MRRTAQAEPTKRPEWAPLSLVDTAPKPEGELADSSEVRQQGLGNAAIGARGTAVEAGAGAAGEAGFEALSGSGGAVAQQGIGNAAVAGRQAGGGGAADGANGKDKGGGGGGGAGAKDGPAAAAGAPGGGGSAGAATAAAVEAKAAESEQAEAGGGDAIQILGQSLPADSAAAFASAQKAASAEIEGERTALADNPPSMEAPSGLAPAAEGEKGEGEAGAGEQEPAASIEEQEGEGEEPPPMDTSHEAAEGPVPTGPPVGPAVDQAPEDPTARVEAFRELLFQMPTSDDSVDTSAGPRPSVELTADADPGQYAGQEVENETILAGENATAALEMQADEGVDDIYPTLPEAMLVAPIEGYGASLEGLGEMEAPPLPADVIGGVNEGAGPQWDAATADAEVKREQGLLDKQTRETDERARVELEISGLEQAAAKEQLGHRATARGEVETARTAWRGELEEARGTYDAERTSVREKLDRDVETEVGKAEGDAEGHLAEGESQAEAARVKAEADAADKRAEAERQSEEEDEGFFGWVASKVKSFFKALQAALKAVFDALRKAVEIIIEGAKKLAAAAIELGRMAVVGLIKVAGAALELAADVFLAAFPEARDRAKAAIRKGVEAAEEAVNRAAEALREGVFALLDGLGKVLTAIIDAYEAIYSAIFKALEFLVLGAIEIMRGLYRLGQAAAAAPGELEGQIYEEMLGADLTQPLPFELTEAEAAQLAAGGPAGPEEAMAGGEGMEAFAAAEAGPAPTGVEMDQVPDIDLDPELEDTLPDDEEGGEIEFGENPDPANSLEAIHAELGYSPAAAPAADSETAAEPAEAGAEAGPDLAAAEPAEEPKTIDQRLDEMIAGGEEEHNCQTEAPTSQEGPAIPLEAKFGPLSKGQRARYMMAKAWTGIKQWLGCNWGKVLLIVLGALAVIAAIVAAVVLSGGTVGAALGGIMAVLGPAIGGAMIVVAIARIFSYLGDWVVKAWGGDIAGGGKALARVAAIAAVEIIFAILTYLTGGAFRLLSSTLKAAGRAATAAAKGGARLAARGLKVGGRIAARGLKAGGKVAARGLKAGGRAGAFVIRQGKLVMRGVGRGVARGAKSLRDLGRRLGAKLRFKGYKIVFKGAWFQLWGRINPWVLLATGKLKRQRAPKGTKIGAQVPVKGSKAKGVVVGVSTKGGKAVKGARVKQIEGMSEAGRKRLSQTLRGGTDDQARAALASQSKLAAAASKTKPPPPDPNLGKVFTSSGKTGKIGDAPLMSTTKKGKPEVTDLAGGKTTLRRPKQGATKTVNPDGTVTYSKGGKSLTYDKDGFPQFQTKGDVHIDPKHVGSGAEAQHFKAANEALGNQLRADPSLAGRLGLNNGQVNHLLKVPPTSSPPPGLTWHHHQNVGRMQLVDDAVHDLFRHTGGMRIWGGGY